MRILVMGKYPSWYERAYGGEAHAQRLFEEMGKLGYEIIIANYVFSGEANGITWKKIS